jgi:hypothetical protein
MSDTPSRRWSGKPRAGCGFWSAGGRQRSRRLRTRPASKAPCLLGAAMVENRWEGNQGPHQITPLPKAPAPPLASAGDLAGAGADLALAHSQCAPQRLRCPMGIRAASPPESVLPTPLSARPCTEPPASVLWGCHGHGSRCSRHIRTYWLCDRIQQNCVIGCRPHQSPSPNPGLSAECRPRNHKILTVPNQSLARSTPPRRHILVTGATPLWSLSEMALFRIWRGAGPRPAQPQAAHFGFVPSSWQGGQCRPAIAARSVAFRLKNAAFRKHGYCLARGSSLFSIDRQQEKESLLTIWLCSVTCHRAGYVRSLPRCPRGAQKTARLATVWSVPGFLFLFFLGFHGFKVFGFEDLVAIETFHVVHAVSTGNDLGAGMLTGGMHKQRLDESYSIQADGVVKPPHAGRVARGVPRGPLPRISPSWVTGKWRFTQSLSYLSK